MKQQRNKNQSSHGNDEIEIAGESPGKSRIHFDIVFLMDTTIIPIGLLKGVRIGWYISTDVRRSIRTAGQSSRNVSNLWFKCFVRFDLVLITVVRGVKIQHKNLGTIDCAFNSVYLTCEERQWEKSATIQFATGFQTISKLKNMCALSFRFNSIDDGRWVCILDVWIRKKSSIDSIWMWPWWFEFGVFTWRMLVSAKFFVCLLYFHYHLAAFGGGHLILAQFTSE